MLSRIVSAPGSGMAALATSMGGWRAEAAGRQRPTVRPWVFLTL